MSTQLNTCVSIPKGEATNFTIDYFNVLYKEFQSPKGRLQTAKLLEEKNKKVIGFNPQRGGYKHVQELDFIISTLCNGVNVFISVHYIKTAHSSENSRDKTLSNPSVYPAAARNQVKIIPHLNETVSKLNPEIFALEIDGNDFWSKC